MFKFEGDILDVDWSSGKRLKALKFVKFVNAFAVLLNLSELRIFAGSKI